MGIPENQCDYAIKRMGHDVLIHCERERDHVGPHKSSSIGSKTYLSMEEIKTEGEWFQV